MAAGIVAACVVLGLLIANFFAGATITVFPRRASITPPLSLQAALDAPVGSLSYQLLSVGGSAKRTAQASGMVQSDTAAEGTITIYNAYSTSPQRLIANTRFQATTAKIYRIHTEVTVPGMKKAANGTLTPGSVQALAYADKPGPDYNISSSMRFTIPGFIGTSRYSKFYATTDSIMGGASGLRPAVSPVDLQNAEGQMRQELMASLPGMATARVPDGFAPIGGTLTYQYGALSNTDAGNNTASLGLQATATVAIIRLSDAANAAAKSQVQGYDGAAVNFADPSKVSFSLATGTPYTAAARSLPLVVSNASSIVWQFDENQLTSGLAGKPRSSFEEVIRGFAPAIARATASLRPFWESSFPSNPADIRVTIEDGN